MASLVQMLQDAAARTRAKKEEMSEEEGASIMAPAIKREALSKETHSHKLASSSLLQPQRFL